MLKNIRKKLQTNDKSAEAKVTKELYVRPNKDKPEDIPSTKRSGAKPGNIYEADTLYMPMDRGFKYVLVVVDAVSGITDAQEMKERDSGTVKKAFEKIFARHHLSMPKYIIHLDQGKEFKNHIIEDYFKKHGVSIKWGKVDRSRQQASVEARNKTIARALFEKQTREELKTKKVNKKWVADLKKVIEAVNEHQEKQQMKDQKKVLPKEPNINKNTIILPVGTKVRLKLMKPRGVNGEKVQGGFRATDIRWTTTIHTISNIILNPAQPVLYQVDDDSSTAYTYNQLQVVKA